MKTLPKLDTFTEAYIRAALWSTNDESTSSGGNPLDDKYDIKDIDLATLVRMKADCAKFQEENKEDIGTMETRAGQDFWLTRNGHGSGFLDGDWPEGYEDDLYNAAVKFGEFNLYVADGKIYH